MKLPHFDSSASYHQNNFVFENGGNLVRIFGEDTVGMTSGVGFILQDGSIVSAAHISDGQYFLEDGTSLEVAYVDTIKDIVVFNRYQPVVKNEIAVGSNVLILTFGENSPISIDGNIIGGGIGYAIISLKNKNHSPDDLVHGLSGSPVFLIQQNQNPYLIGVYRGRSNSGVYRFLARVMSGNREHNFVIVSLLPGHIVVSNRWTGFMHYVSLIFLCFAIFMYILLLFKKKKTNVDKNGFL